MSRNYVRAALIAYVFYITSASEGSTLASREESSRQRVDCRAEIEILQGKIATFQQKLDNALTSSKDFNKLDEKPVITSCSQTLLSDEGTLSDVFQLQIPNSDLPPFPVFCLKNVYNGPAWTVIQKRENGLVDFYRGWDDYVNGFGNIKSEFWLGLEKIHALTASQKHELWVQLEDFEGRSYYAKYGEFVVGDKDTNYTLTKVGPYHGNAGNSLIQHDSQQFTTKDVDNDTDEKGNCADLYTGAWWYDNCYSSNLNGIYFHDQKTANSSGKPDGIVWFTLRPQYSLKYAHMAIRPAV